MRARLASNQRERFNKCRAPYWVGGPAALGDTMMFLLDKKTGDLVRIGDLEQLCNPLRTAVFARDQAGEEEQDWMEFSKDRLVFPSGEELPRCWVDANYRFAHEGSTVSV
jgi:hypothetical protein